MKQRVRAKKSLGQHFLTHEPTAQRIVEALEVDDSGLVLEIGPGMGVLTRHLLEQYGDRLWVVEIDTESVEYLGEHYPALMPRVIPRDFLRFDLSELPSDRIAIIGNFPYNISSQILFRVLEHRERVGMVVGMFQREVARRIVSGPGNKEYGILSVLMGAFFEGEYLFTVDEDQFRPPPRVKSGVIRFTRKADISLPCEPKTLFQVVKMAFNQRRKTLRNALSALWCNELESTGFGGLRPEQLSVADFCHIGEVVDSKNLPIFDKFAQ
ncbi:MAG: ribosomal RNA small subunit methyltransferase A [Bacteroidales bacterium]|nr:ribosomal RNA small subunit methyltransferase A [Bacteroidales bacterium]